MKIKRTVQVQQSKLINILEQVNKKISTSNIEKINIKLIQGWKPNKNDVDKCLQIIYNDNNLSITYEQLLDILELTEEKSKKLKWPYLTKDELNEFKKLIFKPGKNVKFFFLPSGFFSSPGSVFWTTAKLYLPFKNDTIPNEKEYKIGNHNIYAIRFVNTNKFMTYEYESHTINDASFVALYLK